MLAKQSDAWLASQRPWRQEKLDSVEGRCSIFLNTGWWEDSLTLTHITVVFKLPSKMILSFRNMDMVVLSPWLTATHSTMGTELVMIGIDAAHNIRSHWFQVANPTPTVFGRTELWKLESHFQMIWLWGFQKTVICEEGSANPSGIFGSPKCHNL